MHSVTNHNDCLLYTSAAIKNAVASAVTEAGGDAEALKNVPVEKTAEDQTLDADVVIAGAGAAGLAAGIEASRAGAKVIILEKQGVTGGATTRSGGKLLAAGTEWQKKQGYEEDVYKRQLSCWRCCFISHR